MISFETSPDRYRHWKLSIEGPVAILAMDVEEDGGLDPAYKLKLNSYDLGVDIELYDALQRLRFEHPEVGAVILTSDKDRVFSAGANIGMLSRASHVEKVNFCKFTNETRNAIEDAGAHSSQPWICAINGTAAGGGYELALATEHIMLADDGTTAVSLPETPLLGVLPGTGGLTRLVDKRKVRRDHADFLCTTEEGVRGQRAVDWRLVDEVVPRSRLMEEARARALELAAESNRPTDATGVALAPLDRTIDPEAIRYPNISVALDRDNGVADIVVRAPTNAPPTDPDGILAAGCAFWPLALACELDDLILHLRANEPEIGVWTLRTEGDSALVVAADQVLVEYATHWLVREITLYLKRVLKRLDVTSRSLIALVEPGSCYAGTLLELALAADRSYMLDGQFEGDNRPPAEVRLSVMNFGPLPMCNGLTRLGSRFLDAQEKLAEVEAAIDTDLLADEADRLGLVTFAPDDIDWEDEVRLAIEARTSFSPDALSGMEANLRFAGPETLESKIFGRLSAWQNWIFQRPNATGEKGALRIYGTGQRSDFDKRRV